MGFGSRCYGGSLVFPILSFVTVGRWLIGGPHNRSRGSLPELLPCHSLEFPVLTLPTVDFAQRQ